MKEKKRRSAFARRLNRRILLTMFIIMGGVSFWIYTVAFYSMRVNGEANFKTMLDMERENVSRILSDVRVATLNSQFAVEEMLDPPDRLSGVVEQIVSRNPHIRSCGISFVEGYYPQKGRLFMPYAERQADSTVSVRPGGYTRHDYSKEDWFLDVVQTDSAQWSAPFFGGTDGTTPLIAFMVPIHDRNGRVAAVMGADLSLYDLHKNLRQADTWVNNSSDTASIMAVRSFIIDKQGRYIVHPDSSKILKANYFELAKQQPDTMVTMIGRLMTSGAEGHVRHNREQKDIEINGQASVVFFVPVRDTALSIGIVVPNVAIDVFAYAIGGLMLFLIVVGMLVVLLVNKYSIRRMVRPLAQLTLSAEEVAKGNFETPLPVIKKKDEIRQLRDAFEEMQHNLTHYVEDLKATTAQKAAIDNELSIAHDIQMDMLPKIYPPYPERTDIDIFGALTPAKSVGGDLFDFYIRDEKLFFCIGDVSGKGVPASLVMAVTRTLFRNVSAHVSQPEAIVATLNDAVAQDNEENMFVTLFVGVLDLLTGTLDYCNAGHNAPLLVGQRVGLLPCEPNLPIGITSGMTFVPQQTVVDSQTTIFLYTDGLTEAENASHDQFGEERMLHVAATLVGANRIRPLPMIGAMTEEVTAFVNGAEQSDDLTMLAITYMK